MPFCTSQNSEALLEELTRAPAMTTINCPVFSGIQRSNDNCVVDICFCVKSDVAFIQTHCINLPRATLACAQQSCLSKTAHCQDSQVSLPMMSLLHCQLPLYARHFSFLMLASGLPKQLAMIRVFLSICITNK